MRSSCSNSEGAAVAIAQRNSISEGSTQQNDWPSELLLTDLAAADESSAAAGGGSHHHNLHHSHSGKAHHGDEDEMMERSMTEGATKEKPERQFEHKISAKAAHAAVEGAHHQVADGVAERHARLAAQHALREAQAHEEHEKRPSAARAVEKDDPLSA